MALAPLQKKGPQPPGVFSSQQWQQLQGSCNPLVREEKECTVISLTVSWLVPILGPILFTSYPTVGDTLVLGPSALSPGAPGPCQPCLFP